jgi:hypothetical protein
MSKNNLFGRNLSTNSLFGRDDEVIQWNLDQTVPDKEHDPASKLQRDSELASLIYGIRTKKGKEEVQTKLHGYEIFSITTDSKEKELNKGRFQAVAAINRETKEVVVITAGTRLLDIKNPTYKELQHTLADAKDDLHLLMGSTPKKLKAAKTLNKRILKELGDKVADYKFHYTGHSLGAFMSDVAATDMGIQLHQKGLLTKGKISTVTFDNPGAYTLVRDQLKELNQHDKTKEIKRHKAALKKISQSDNNKIKKENQKHKDKLKKIEQERVKLNKEWREKVQYKAFNNRPNFINQNDKQVGEEFIIVPNNQKARSSFSQCMSWASKRVPIQAFKKIFNFFSYGSLIEQGKDHSIDNFIDVLKKEDGDLLYVKKGSKHPISLDDAAYNIKPRPYDAELFVKLKKKISKRPEGPQAPQPDYSMTFKDPNTGLTTRIYFTKDELSRARRTPTKAVDKQKAPSTKRKTARKIHPVNHQIPPEAAANATTLITELAAHLSNTNSSTTTKKARIKSSFTRSP